MNNSTGETITQICKDIFRIAVQTPANIPQNVNNYLIRGGKRVILIDTGFQCEENRLALLKGLHTLGAVPGNLDVIVTHLHPDHIGLAQFFANAGSRVYYPKYPCIDRGEPGRGRALTRIDQSGLPLECRQAMETYKEKNSCLISDIVEGGTPLDDNDELSVGDRTIKCLRVSGHTDAELCLVDIGNRLVFTGDHILFGITPNVGLDCDEENPLESYFNGFQRLSDYEDFLALPGHGESGILRDRMAELKAHHLSNMEKCISTLSEGVEMCAAEIAEQMRFGTTQIPFSRLSPGQKCFVVIECISHLEYLVKTGRCADSIKDGIRYYTTIS